MSCPPQLRHEYNANLFEGGLILSSSITGALEPSAEAAPTVTGFRGNDRLLLGIIMGVLTFWLFAQTTLNIAPDMQKDLGLGTSLMNIAVAATALFSGIFIVFIGGFATVEPDLCMSAVAERFCL